MPTFIDESGDTGTKQGATRYFRLAAVFFENSACLERYTERLSALRVQLRLPQSFEFHAEMKRSHGGSVVFTDLPCDLVSECSESIQSGYHVRKRMTADRQLPNCYPTATCRTHKCSICRFSSHFVIDSRSWQMNMRLIHGTSGNGRPFRRPRH